MKILVTGLCLSRNLGGPAMGLTLVNELQKLIPDVRFKFAVDPASWEQEREWANKYNLEIVRCDSFFSYWLNANFPFNILLKTYKKIKGQKRSITKQSDRYRIHNDFMNAYQWAEIIIDMMGISYVGDGVRGVFEGVHSYSNYYYANKHNKPFVRFIQSIGPFDDWKVRFFAKKEFASSDYIFARGKHAATYCRNILVKNLEKVHTYPDSAILLPSVEDSWVKDYLVTKHLKPREYIVLSPSAIIRNTVRKSVGGSVGKRHVESFYLIAKKLLQQGETLLFLPHMYSNNKYECDREVCYEVKEMLQQNLNSIDNLSVVDDDIDPMQAKGLIKQSKAAVVSRYHALVAALSTGVPVVTIGWNIKYYDLMEYYSVSDKAIDMRKLLPDAIAIETIEKLNSYTKETIEKLKSSQHENEIKVKDAFTLLYSWIKTYE